jgi:hypothetical protein
MQALARPGDFLVTSQSANGEVCCTVHELSERSMKATVIVRPAAVASLVLLVPLAMTIADRHRAPGQGWHWGPLDFLVMGILLFGAGMAYELVSRRLPSSTARAALAIGILIVVVCIWIELAVGGISQLTTWLAR